ncbi:MAG: ComEC/Rec2 family competence protein [Solirubrobacterales bacterium]
MALRLWALLGATAGLGLSPFAGLAAGRPEIAALAAGAVAIAAAGGGPRALRGAALAMACAGLGLIAGGARLDAIAAGALRGDPGSRIAVTGYVAAVPRRSEGMVRVQVSAPAGRVLFEAPEPVPDLEVGEGVGARGVLRRPPNYYRETLAREGIAMVLHAARIDLTGGDRGGVEGRLDAIRRRAESALGEGVPSREAALARGFVLGQDDRIDPATVEDFRRSGLSHLLAVSGQNVVLLVLLAAPLLALAGLTLRQRLLWTCGLIALYVPLAGGGPSIQRAGVMGAAGIAATLAGRPASRAHALLAAAAVTLALNPRASGDVGWQLSFAAVVGIFALAAPLRTALPGGSAAKGWRRALAEGAAVTLAATLATTPLIAHHFGRFSVTSLLANLLVLPAVAPSMWLGMAVAALAQVPGFPVVPLNAVNSLLLGYVAQIAEWCGRPAWAVAEVRLSGPLAIGAAYAATGVATALALGALRRWERRRLRGRPGADRAPMRSGGRGPADRAIPRLAALAGVAAGVLLLLGEVSGGPESGAPPRLGLRVEVLDVGQGDAILLQPAGAGAVLVDGGPPGDGLVEKLRAAGVGELAALLLTHDQSDHAGGVRDLLGSLPVHRVLYGAARPHLLGEARAAGAKVERVAEGSELRSGRLRLEVLWPPAAGLGPAAAADPNQGSLVLLARWGGFSMLLTGDAEAESVPIDPGPLDVLKVAHHGSRDAGLAALLDRTVPEAAVISVGRDNPYGHPTPQTVATLRGHRVAVFRTDLDGTVTVSAGPRRFSVHGEG